MDKITTMSLFKQAPDRYNLHRLALAPLLSENTSQAFQHIRETILKSDQETFFQLIIDNGLGALWYKSVYKCPDSCRFPHEFIDKLRKASLYYAAEYVRQQHTLQKINDILGSKNIPYAVFKGVHIRELIYDNPAGRYACDIDILVAKQDKTATIKALVKAGFIFHPIAENISHEGHITKDQTSIDLHWDILRPGRTRIDLTEEFLHTSQQSNNHWHLDNEATLFIMLVHPVFTKYTTTPQASLIRMIDLISWIQTQRINWGKLQNYLKRGGVQTAAWITATWLEILTGETLPASFMQKIKPSGIRTWYLRKWLEKNLSTRLLNYPFLIQAGFTLPAHDSFRGSIHAVKSLAREKKEAAGNMKKLLQEIQNHSP